MKRMLFALCLVLLTFFPARPAEAGTTKCCLAEWQGGGVCPAGSKLYALCGPGCNLFTGIGFRLNVRLEREGSFGAAASLDSPAHRLDLSTYDSL